MRLHARIRTTGAGAPGTGSASHTPPRTWRTCHTPRCAGVAHGRPRRSASSGMGSSTPSSSRRSATKPSTLAHGLASSVAGAAPVVSVIHTGRCVKLLSAIVMTYARAVSRQLALDLERLAVHCKPRILHRDAEFMGITSWVSGASVKPTSRSVSPSPLPNAYAASRMRRSRVARERG